MAIGKEEEEEEEEKRHLEAFQKGHAREMNTFYGIDI